MAPRETPQQKLDRLQEQGRGFRRVFARAGSGASSRSVLEAVLIFLAIAGSALAATTWDAIFNDDDTAEVATAPSSTGARNNTAPKSTAPTAPPTSASSRSSTSGSAPKFSEIAGTYRLVFAAVSHGPCSADPNDNPPIDVEASIVRTYAPGTAGHESDLGDVRLSGDEGEWEFTVTAPGTGGDSTLLSFQVPDENALGGAFFKDEDGVGLRLAFEALGCGFLYSGPRVG